MGIVQIMFITTVQNIGEIGEDRKHPWKNFWKMRNLKDRYSRDDGDLRSEVPTSHDKPVWGAHWIVFGLEAMEGHKECQVRLKGGWWQIGRVWQSRHWIYDYTLTVPTSCNKRFWSSVTMNTL